jgi:folate-binding protein YgfZ
MTTEPASFETQYDELRRGRAVVPLNDFSSVTLRGADRQRFLHNFCTNDVARLTPGGSCEAFFTDVKGKILGHGLVTCRDSELVIVGAPRQAPMLVDHLERYVLRDDVELRDTSAERSFLLAVGECVAGEFPWNLVDREYAGIVEASSLESARIAGEFADRGFVLVAWPAFTAARIEAGVGLFGVDFGNENFPQEVGRDREAISFTKGCYLGQETVARIDALGHVNRRLVGVRFFAEQVPDTGMDLLQTGKKVGHVTSAVFSPQWSAPLALAMVRRAANSPGTQLESALGACEVVALPLR